MAKVSKKNSGASSALQQQENLTIQEENEAVLEIDLKLGSGYSRPFSIRTAFSVVAGLFQQGDEVARLFQMSNICELHKILSRR